jgi:hypothetical protein
MTKLRDVDLPVLHEFITNKALVELQEKGSTFHIVGARELMMRKNNEDKLTIIVTLHCPEFGINEKDEPILRDLTMSPTAYRRGLVDHFKKRPNDRIGPVTTVKKVFENKKKGSRGSEVWLFEDVE